MKRMWLLFAILSAVFAAATSILAKIGIEGVDSNLATAIRTVVVGTSSVVTKDIPSNSVAVGNPCKVIKEL